MRSILAVFAIMTLAWPPTSATAQVVELSDRLVAEIAVYRVRAGAAEALDASRPIMAEAVSRYPGFVSGRSFVSSADPSLYLDYFVWSSLDDAVEAATNVMRDPAALPYMASIERIVFYGHGQVRNSSRLTDIPDASANSVVVFRIYAAPYGAAESLDRAAPMYGALLAETPPVEFATVARFFEYPSFFMDYLHVSDTQEVPALRENMHTVPGIFEYVASTTNLVVDDVFVPVFSIGSVELK